VGTKSIGSGSVQAVAVRRWIAVGGLTLAIAGGTAATVRGVAGAQYEAETALRLRGPSAVPVHSLSDPERIFDEPEVRTLVHLRLGETPPVRVEPAAGGTVLVRTRGASAQRAAEASRTYATSYVDVRRRQADTELAAAAASLEGRIAQLKVAPDQAAAAEQIASLAGRLEDLRAQRQRPSEGPEVAVTRAQPVDDGARRAWILAALGGVAALGAAASARRS
jgi:hypothetical protein